MQNSKRIFNFRKIAAQYEGETQQSPICGLPVACGMLEGFNRCGVAAPFVDMKKYYFGKETTSLFQRIPDIGLSYDILKEMKTKPDEFQGEEVFSVSTEEDSCETDTMYTQSLSTSTSDTGTVQDKIPFMENRGSSRSTRDPGRITEHSRETHTAHTKSIPGDAESCCDNRSEHTASTSRATEHERTEEIEQKQADGYRSSNHCTTLREAPETYPLASTLSHELESDHSSDSSSEESDFQLFSSFFREILNYKGKTDISEDHMEDDCSSESSTTSHDTQIISISHEDNAKEHLIKENSGTKNIKELLTQHRNRHAAFSAASNLIGLEIEINEIPPVDEIPSVDEPNALKPCSTSEQTTLIDSRGSSNSALDEIGKESPQTPTMTEVEQSRDASVDVRSLSPIEHQKITGFGVMRRQSCQGQARKQKDFTFDAKLPRNKKSLAVMKMNLNQRIGRMKRTQTKKIVTALSEFLVRTSKVRGNKLLTK